LFFFPGGHVQKRSNICGRIANTGIKNHKMTRKFTELVTGMLLILVTGLFWGTWFSLSRTMEGLSAETFLTIGKEIIKNVGLPMSIIMPASLFGLIILLSGSWKIRSLYFYCILVTLLLFVIALIITVVIEVPMDNRIKTWEVSTIPSDWTAIRDRWEYYNTMRTFVTLCGMAFFITAIMNRDMKTNA
jgi:uncharacterized membrane protein